MRRTISALAVGTVVATAATPAAAAPEPGLTVDPQSPAGVEYQIPLDTGRGHGGGHHGGGGSGGAAGTSGGGGGTGGSSGTGSAPVLFGSGITPSGSASTAGKIRKGSGTKGRGGAGSGSAGDTGTGSGRTTLPPVTASANYSTTGPIAALVAAILLAGAGLGLFLRRRARPRRIFS